MGRWQVSGSKFQVSGFKWQTAHCSLFGGFMTQELMRHSLYFAGPGRVEMRQEPMPVAGVGQVLVKTAVSAVSAGTEMLLYFVADAAQVLPVPEGMSAETAVFLPNMETAVSFVMDGQPMIGEQVLVLGQGVVGLLTTALLAQFPLASLVAVDGYSLRRE